MTDNKICKIEQAVDENIILNWFKNKDSENNNFVKNSDSEEDFIIRIDLDTNSEKEA